MSTPQEQAQAHADLLLSTGMAYEITPHTIAYRAFLDGFAAGAASNADTKRLDWIESSETEAFKTESLWCVSPDAGDAFGLTLREAIDVALEREAKP